MSATHGPDQKLCPGELYAAPVSSVIRECDADAAISALSDRVFLVGNRYGHHATHSGYEGFQRYVGHILKPPVKFRFLRIKGSPMLGWRIDSAVGRLMRRECYSVALLLTELGAAVHMTGNRGALYHVLYGDTDICWLGRVRQILGARVVATFHEAAEGLEYLKIDRRITDALDGVILVSDSQRPYFEQFLPAERIFVIPHGVDTEFFRPPATVSEEPVCLTVGGHLREFGMLREAIDQVHAVVPEMRFVAVGVHHGHNGPRFDHPRVEFLQGISDEKLRNLYQGAKAAVFPFRQSTANNSLLEALACGTPVVATDVGGVREYMGDAGMVCPLYDSGEMANAVLRLLRDKSLATRLRQRARERALEFDYRLVAKKHIQVYSEISARRAQAGISSAA